MAVDVAATLPALAVLAVVFSALGIVARRSDDAPPWWRKPDLATDLCYALVLPSVAHYGRIVCLTTGLVLFHHATGPSAAALLDRGDGPLSVLPFAAQVPAYLLLADLGLYATHRAFHGAALWRYHAVHHSSEHLEWISAQRFHPFDLFWHAVFGDCVLLLLGISPRVLVWLAPFTVGMSALTHANLDWDFGPLRAVLASPAYHRWHHTGAAQGGSRNFAANFPVFDLMFGTYSRPAGPRPHTYGVTERDVPADFGGQLLHPFRRTRPPLSPPRSGLLSLPRRMR